MTPQGGRLISDTFYDSRGWTARQNNGWWDPATTPNTTLVAPASLTPVPQLPDQTSFVYDGLGRAVQERRERNNQVVSVTTTIYNGDRTTVVPPAGGVVKTTVTDAIGRKTELHEYSTRPTVDFPADTFTGVFSITGGSTASVHYGFDARGNESTVTEPGPRTWTTVEDLLGNTVSKTDPDAGVSTGMRYDANGNIIQTTDARGETISYTYDALNRKTGRYASTVEAQATSNQLAKWVYDNSDNAVPGMTYPRGHLTTSTAYWNGAAYIVKQKNFNVFGKSLGSIVTVPSAEGNLAGNYGITNVYSTTTGLLIKEVYSAQGGLPGETVNHTYSGAMDLPDTLNGLGGYSQGTTYDAWGRVNQQKVGAEPNLGFVTNTWDPHSGRLTRQLVTRAVGTPTDLDQQDYTYDLSGNILKQVETRFGSAASSETQCYDYDELNQLTEAWTATDGCATTPTVGSSTMVGSLLGSSSAYWTSWSVDMMGWRSQVQHSTIGGTDTRIEYGYDGNNTNQPHVLTSTTTTGGTNGSTTYSYDKAGNMTARNANRGNQELRWNTYGQLTEIRGGTGGDTTFQYDADGAMMLQKDPGKHTLYLGSQQFTLNTVSGAVTGTRYYALPGGGNAIRTGTAASAYSFALGDQHGTPMLYLDSTMTTPTWRQYTPYGAARGPAVTAPDNRGFLDKVLNANTGLTQVGARQYDPLTGRFISLDPVLETDDPQQLNGYGYGANNPITHADPTGERVDDDGGWVGPHGNGAKIANAWATEYQVRRSKLLFEAVQKRNALAWKGGSKDWFKGKTFTGSYSWWGGASAGVSGVHGCAEVQACTNLGLRQNSRFVSFTKAVTWSGTPTGIVYDKRTVAVDAKTTSTKYLVEKEICHKCQTNSRNAGQYDDAKMRPGGALDGAPKGEGMMSKAAPYLKGAAKWGGRALTVAAVGVTVYDIATATPEERPRVATREVSSLAGGFAGAAVGFKVGLMLAPFAGPLAPAVPLVGAVIGGIAGSELGSRIGSGIADLFGW